MPDHPGPPPAPDWRARIPNILTMARLALAAVFVGVLSAIPHAGAGDRPGLLLTAAAIFLIAAITDALDGHLARRWNAISAFGRVMDPFADKVLVLGGFILLGGAAFANPDPTTGPAQISHVYPWMGVVILARELLVTSIRAVFESSGVAFPAGPSGKAKMILQSVAVPAALVGIATGVATSPPWSIALAGLIWLTVLVTVLSAWPYLRTALASRKPKENTGS